MKKIVSNVFVMMCALFLVNIAQASGSKSATQKSNRVALDATTRWLAATLTKSGGEKYADEDMQYSTSYQKASFKNGVGHVAQHFQRYVSYELNEGEVINQWCGFVVWSQVGLT